MVVCQFVEPVIVKTTTWYIASLYPTPNILSQTFGLLLPETHVLAMIPTRVYSGVDGFWSPDSERGLSVPVGPSVHLSRHRVISSPASPKAASFTVGASSSSYCLFAGSRPNSILYGDSPLLEGSRLPPFGEPRLAQVRPYSSHLRSHAAHNSAGLSQPPPQLSTAPCTRGCDVPAYNPQRHLQPPAQALHHIRDKLTSWVAATLTEREVAQNSAAARVACG